jgi:hypothetical protein
MENDRKQEAERIVKEMEKNTELSKVEEMIKDNKISFEHEGKEYRVRLLNQKEKEELDTLRRKKFGQLIQDKDILLEKDLIKVLIGRGIDIDSSNDEIRKYDAEESSLQMKLGEAIAKNEPGGILEEYKKQIEDLRLKKAILNTQKTLLLEYSLENQLLNYVAKIITYLSSDILVDGSWKRLFNSIEEFENYSDDGLVEKLASYSMILQYI